MMLGAKKHKVTLLMFIETIIVGVASLAIGIAAGIGQLLMNQLDFSRKGYKAFYIPSMTITCIFFFVLFGLSVIMNSMKLSRISVHADSQTERDEVKEKMTAVVAFLGLLLLGIGYNITATVGTYMLFGSLLPVMMKKVQSNKKHRDKGLKAFTFAQLNFRMDSLTNMLATVAILVALWELVELRS